MQTHALFQQLPRLPPPHTHTHADRQAAIFTGWFFFVLLGWPTVRILDAHILLWPMMKDHNTCERQTYSSANLFFLRFILVPLPLSFTSLSPLLFSGFGKKFTTSRASQEGHLKYISPTTCPFSLPPLLLLLVLLFFLFFWQFMLLRHSL